MELPRANFERAIRAEFANALKLHNAKKLGEAEAAYLGLLMAKPDHADAQHNLGLIKLDRGLPGQALAYVQYAIALKPDLAEAHNTLGSIWRALKRPAEAEAAYRRAVEINPKFALGWFNLGHKLAQDNRAVEAEKAYRKAIAANPDYLEAHLNLGNVLRSLNRQSEALALMQDLVKKAPKYDLAHNNLANLYRDLDKLPEAAASYRRALELNPHFALAWLNLGTVLNHLGCTGDSVAALKRAIAVAPRFGEPYMQLASTVRLALDDPYVGAMRTFFDDPGVAAKDRMYFAFALGRVFDEHGQYDKAFQAIKEGNRLKRASLQFDIVVERDAVQRTRAVFTRQFLHTPASTLVDETPIFIIGMMRSGTTLLERILASHPQVEAADELEWIPQLASGMRLGGRAYPECLPSATAEDLSNLGKGYTDRLRGRFGPGCRYITDKLPGNFLFVGLIHLILPNARIIHMQRDPYDTCLSIYSTLFATQHHYAYDMRELGEFYLVYRNLMNHWDEVLPGKVCHQRYEDLVAAPEQSVRRILDFCGLPFDPKCLEFQKNEGRVKTASSQQVREGLHARSVGRWRNYEEHLGEWKRLFAAQA